MGNWIFFTAAASFWAGILFWMMDLSARLPKHLRRKTSLFASSETEERIIERLAYLGSKKMKNDMYLAEKDAAGVAYTRILSFVGGALVVGLVAFYFGVSPAASAVAGSAVGGGLAVLPTYSVRAKAKKTRYEIWQAFPLFMSQVGMALASQMPSEAVRYAAKSSDHWTFKHFQNLIPPPNAQKQFGERLYDFGDEYGIPDLANRGLALKAAEGELGAKLKDSVVTQAAACRTAVVRQMEEDMVGKSGLTGTAPIVIILALIVFIMYPTFTSLGGDATSIDGSSLGEATEQAP